MPVHEATTTGESIFCQSRRNVLCGRCNVLHQNHQTDSAGSGNLVVIFEISDKISHLGNALSPAAEDEVCRSNP